jgi:hypothetical protein
MNMRLNVPKSALAAIVLSLSAPVGFASPADAAVVEAYYGSKVNYAEYRGYESDFWSDKTIQYEEDFEGFGSGEYVNANASSPGIISTAVGDFQATAGGQYGRTLAIYSDARDNPDSSYEGGRYGRYDVTHFGNGATDGHWLDSKDSKGVSWNMSGLNGAINMVSFWMTDVLDVSGKLSFTTATGGTGSQLIQFPGSGGLNSNAALFFVTIAFTEAVDSFTFAATAHNDGWGIDDIKVGIAPVPLPAAVWFLLTALGGLVGARWLKGAPVVARAT